jgi:hypothetical protein
VLKRASFGTVASLLEMIARTVADSVVMPAAAAGLLSCDGPGLATTGKYFIEGRIDK